MMNHSKPPPEEDLYDPVLLHTRREAWVIVGAFVVCLLWSVPWCYLAGYPEPSGGQVSTVLGIPAWVFWGVFVPWLAADVFGFWFCFFYMADDPLGEADDMTTEDGDPAEASTRDGEDRDV